MVEAARGPKVYEVFEHIHMLWLGLWVQPGVMVEAARGPKLHPTSILEVYEVFEHIHMLWMGAWVKP
jgi:hypothetical protein